MPFHIFKKSLNKLGYDTSLTKTLDELNLKYFIANKDNDSYEVIKCMDDNSYEVRKLFNSTTQRIARFDNQLECIDFFAL